MWWMEHEWCGAVAHRDDRVPRRDFWIEVFNALKRGAEIQPVVPMTLQDLRYPY
jgi:hypothetical protein